MTKKSKTPEKKTKKTKPVKHEPPLSESKTKRKDVTKQECIEELRRMAEAEPDKVISRNYFRCNSNIAESGWNQYFGTFEEFKKQAGVKLTRHARRMETDIAKHASLENYRQMTVDKQGFEDKYLKPDNKRFQTVLVGSDVHDIECDPFWRFLFIQTAKRVQPEKIVINGDLFDLPEFGRFTVDPREWDVVGRIKWCHTFLKDLRNAAPNSELILIEGNHEYRLLRHLSEATPAMKAVLSDLHEMTVEELLGLDQYEVNYVAPADLGTFTQADMRAELKRNWLCLYECLIAHHFSEGSNFGMPGWNGHHHSHVVNSYYSPVFGSYEWHQLGSGHKREASYTNGEKWGNGFLLVHVDTHSKNSQFEYIDTTNDHVVIGGKWYCRDD